MTTRARTFLVQLALIGVLACGGDSLEGLEPECIMRFTVQDQGSLVAPRLVVLSSTIDSGPFSGVRTLSWSVSQGGQELPFTLRDEDGFAIEFLADQPGPYDLTLSGSIGSEECRGQDQTVNVQANGALEGSYLLRVVAPGTDYSHAITVYGGADFGMGTIDVGSAAEQMDVLDDTGAPLDAFIRVRPAGLDEVGTEAATNTLGQVSLALAPGAYDVDVIPYSPARAPFSSAISAPNLPPSVSSPVPGTVAASVDASGPLAGAMVKIGRDGGPGAAAATDGTGSASVPAVAGSSTRIDVIPPEGSALPVVGGTRPSAPDSIAVDYASISSTSFAPTILRSGGGAADGARVFLTAIIPDAATISFGGVDVEVDGRYSALLTADAGGDIAASNVPAGIYTVVLMHDGQVSVATEDLTSSAPPTLQLSTPLSVAGVVRLDGSPVAGARVRAVGQGVLTGIGAEPSPAVTDTGGNYSLDLPEDGDYQLIVDGDLDGGYATARSAVTVTPTTGVDVDLQEALRLTGAIVDGGAAVTGASVFILEPTDGTVVGRALTDGEGNFAIPVPDPGTN